MTSLVGSFAKAEHAEVALTGETTVYKPNGTRLLVLRRGAVPSDAMDAAWDFMYECRHEKTTNRGHYAGPAEGRVPDWVKKKGEGAYFVSGTRYRFLKEDGTLTNTSYGIDVRSAVAGSLDRYPRVPFCRETEITTRHAEKWGKAQPFIQAVANVMKDSVPDRYAAQLQMANQTHPAYVLPGTPFTTITVNNTVAGAYHYDKGDYKDGFGVMAVFRKGQYRGGDLVFPEYGVSADLHHGDVVLFDSHEMHGNVPFIDTVGTENEDWVRISIVFYYRLKIHDCLAPDKEMERARNLRGSLST
jgi:hypothetical protein